MNDRPHFDALEQTALADLRGSAWDGFLSAMRPWLDHTDADIRRRAVDRLVTAVF